MKEYFPEFFHRFDVKDDDEYIVFIIRYDKDINEYGIALNSAQGFSNESDAERANDLLNGILRFTSFENPTTISYESRLYKKDSCFFIDGYWRPYTNISIENENDKILQR